MGGQIDMLVAGKEPGNCVKNPESSITEFVVQDALSFVQVQGGCNNEKKLHIPRATEYSTRGSSSQ